MNLYWRIDRNSSKGSQELSTHSHRSQPSTHLATWNHLQLQSEVLAKQRREQQEPRLRVGVGWKRKTTICRPVQKRERFKKETENLLAGTLDGWGGFKFQTNNSTNHRGRQTAEWLSGSSRNPILFSSTTSLCHCHDFRLRLTNACLRAEKSRQAGEKITAAPWLHVIWMHCRSLSFRVVILQRKWCLNILLVV